LGGVGLPGDNSSPSRFIRAAFIKQNARALTGEAEISQFFHILGSVEQVEGCVQVQDKWERTQYTSCIDTKRNIYYYRTYENPSITAVRLTKAAAQGNELQRFPLSNSLLVHSEN
jgi:choloylglycine hydrolase